MIVDGQARHASQLYEAALEGIVLFLILFIYTRKPRPMMAPSGLFLIFYGLFRIVLEFVREPNQQNNNNTNNKLTTGQLLSVPMVIAGIVLFSLAHRAPSDTPAGAAPTPSSSRRVSKKAS